MLGEKLAIPIVGSKACLSEVIERFENSTPFKEFKKLISADSERIITISGIVGSSYSILISLVARSLNDPLIIVMQTPEEAEDLFEDLVSLTDLENVALFPSLQTPPFEFRSPSAEIIGRRLSTLSNLKNNQAKITVTSVAAIIEPTATIDDFNRNSLFIKISDEMEISSLTQKLVELGFQRVSLVEEIGDFAVRGGLIDFFSPGFEYPIRIEFFGDTIDTIRHFDVSSQRTTGRMNEVNLLPRREVSIIQETIDRYIDQLPESDGNLIRARYLNDPELPGLEWLAVAFGLKRGCLLDFIPENSRFFLHGMGNFDNVIEDLFLDAEKHRDRLRERFQKPPEINDYYQNRECLSTCLNNNRVIDKVPFKGGRDKIIDFGCREHPSFGSRLDLLAGTINNFKLNGVKYFIAADNAGQASRLGDLLADKMGESLVPRIEVALLKGGFVSKENKLAILTDHQIFGRYFRRKQKKKYKEGIAIQDYTSLTDGDFVVHTDFGIAQYCGLKTIKVETRDRDCLLLKYAGDDKLYVPIEEFNRVSKYAGKDGAPKLTTLGGPGWEKTKSKTKKAIADMAAELIKIYAERKTRSGISFKPDTTWMKQLEASFIYDETPDQQKAIDAIKADMESPNPMDRLVCGDVGYGKTEVAVRAAFKAVESDKQVAVLVPTTILAQQHLTTFRERLEDFPIKIEMLSRFRTRKEQKAIVKELADGKIDIVIGTHRLLSKDVRIPNLGLLVVDEEQRFGVRHKETLRKLKATVDTIAMTATPIPRTLQMSLMGVRDMSLINTSPKDRLPIMTTISEFNAEIIAEAILKEVDRGGQIFFVHNRVQTIEAIYRYLKRLIPQVEIAVAHGQMHERSLEGIMLAFLSRQFQVLLSTSIIESGLDIPSVNTIIINRADRFGLAQLYQLRGRVGRSSVHASAYLLTPPYRLLTEDARKRLRAIEAHAELGSGFALAMKDLEIRGAGNILGAQQSGFIEEVGFDLYARLLEEAVAEIKGEEIHRAPETKIETDLQMMIPDDYINIKQQKVEVYQKLAGAKTLDEIEKIREDIEDRYGKAPEPVNNLIEAIAVKVSAWANGIAMVIMKNGLARLYIEPGKTITRKDIESYHREIDYPLEFSMGKETIITIDLSQLGETSRLPYLKAILNRI